MGRRYQQITALFVVVLLFFWIKPSLEKLLSFESNTSNGVKLISVLDHETAFSIGLRVPLSAADQSTLEMIPGLSYRVTQRLIEHRRELLVEAKRVPDKETLKKIHGIGDNTARKILEFISIR